jgi:hypothetical protein
MDDGGAEVKPSLVCVLEKWMMGEVRYRGTSYIVVYMDASVMRRMRESSNLTERDSGRAKERLDAWEPHALTVSGQAPSKRGETMEPSTPG